MDEQLKQENARKVAEALEVANMTPRQRAKHELAKMLEADMDAEVYKILTGADQNGHH